MIEYGDYTVFIGENLLCPDPISDSFLPLRDVTRTDANYLIDLATAHGYDALIRWDGYNNGGDEENNADNGE